MTKPAAIPHTFWCTTRWGDLDALGHVNNIKLIQYIQEAIFDLIREGEHDDVLPDGYMIARHEVDYRRQLHHRADQPVPLQIWVTAIGTNSFTVRTETRRGGNTVFEARTVCVARDHRTGMSRPLTDSERAHLARHRVVEPTPRPPHCEHAQTGANASPNLAPLNPGANPGANQGQNRGPKQVPNPGPGPQKGPSRPGVKKQAKRQYLRTDMTAAVETMRRGWRLCKSAATSRSSV